MRRRAPFPLMSPPQRSASRASRCSDQREGKDARPPRVSSAYESKSRARQDAATRQARDLEFDDQAEVPCCFTKSTTASSVVLGTTPPTSLGCTLALSITQSQEHTATVGSRRRVTHFCTGSYGTLMQAGGNGSRFADDEEQTTQTRDVSVAISSLPVMTMTGRYLVREFRWPGTQAQRMRPCVKTVVPSSFPPHGRLVFR